MRTSRYLKKIALIIAIMIAALNVASAQEQAQSLSGYFLVNGKWQHGTLMTAGSIILKDGTATAQPPWTLILDDNTMDGDVKEPKTIPFKQGPSIMAEINLNETVTAQPPSTLILDDNTMTGNVNDPKTILLKKDPSIMAEINLNCKITISSDGINLSSDDPLTVTICDIESGAEVYKKENVKSENIPANALKADRMYIMRIVDKDGKSNIYEFGL